MTRCWDNDVVCGLLLVDRLLDVCAAVPQPPAPAPPPRPAPAAHQSSQPTSAGDLAGAGGALEPHVEAQLEAVVGAGLLQREDFNERIMAALRGMTVRPRFAPHLHFCMLVRPFHVTPGVVSAFWDVMVLVVT